jgi:hypothetical protein
MFGWGSDERRLYRVGGSNGLYRGHVADLAARLKIFACHCELSREIVSNTHVGHRAPYVFVKARFGGPFSLYPFGG